MIPIEIEQKFRVDSHTEVAASVVAMGGIIQPVESHRDVYLRHPCRDFGKSGEAFRIRYVNDSVVVTYKGPKEAGPVKTRSEIELPLVDATADGWMDIFLALGFTVANEVRKIRTPHLITVEETTVCVTCDAVEKLGNFVEVEVLLSDRSQISSVQARIAQLSQSLGLRDLEPRSYLRQILELPAPNGS
ncbi:MAG: class IV adenylate cyclase [Planctomycetota bacterium]|nr:class IV adenylate cyclase [Planctomycetota bacterium]